jgi:uncharacterized membrane protein YfcA
MTLPLVAVLGLAALALLSAAVQSAVGFGQSLLLAPALLAAVDPHPAVLASLLLALLVNVLVLTERGRVRQVDRRQAGRLTLAAVPGMALGLVVLAAVSRPALQVAVGATVLVAVLLRRRRPRAVAPRPSAPADAAAGFACGLLNTTTSLSGPPLVLRLAGGAPAAVRDTLTATLLSVNVVSAALLLAVGPGRSGGGVALAVALSPAILVGHRLGRATFERSSPAQFERAATALIVVAGVLSVVGPVVGRLL